ncbi:DNA repair protein RecO [Bacillus solitudinis]|uniref:DNA repair protein RecO n=1 Tax=Bacillus solitudinis TaxID=2014074 RepID=UPI000C2438EB|nr:DNA repair protein RecO [Bacillus solitudinis]
MLQKVEGIVIRTTDYGESNKIVTIYSKELGKIGVMSRGSKKPKSRLTAVSQLFIHGMFLLQKSQGLGTLSQGEIIDSFREVRNDLFRASYATYVVELTDKLTDDRKPSSAIFNLLSQTLHLLNEGVEPEILLRIYEMKMLSVAGIQPQLDECVHCHLTDLPVAFSIRHAGFLCKRCVHIDDNARRISPQTARLLRLFFYIDLNRLGQISLKEETRATLRAIINDYYDEYSGVTLKSRRFLEQLEKMDLPKPDSS